MMIERTIIRTPDRSRRCRTADRCWFALEATRKRSPWLGSRSRLSWSTLPTSLYFTWAWKKTMQESKVSAKCQAISNLVRCTAIAEAPSWALPLPLLHCTIIHLPTRYIPAFHYPPTNHNCIARTLFSCALEVVEHLVTPRFTSLSTIQWVYMELLLVLVVAVCTGDLQTRNCLWTCCCCYQLDSIR